MDKESFSRLIADIYLFFDRNFPKQEQIDIWFDDVKYINNQTIDQIFDVLKKNDKLPTNLPKAIKAAFYQLPKAKKPIQYDKYDDPRYPIENLWKALDILENKGDDEFINYCRNANIPLQDIERVRNKYNCAITKQDVKDLAKNIFK